MKYTAKLAPLNSFCLLPSEIIIVNKRRTLDNLQKLRKSNVTTFLIYLWVWLSVAIIYVVVRSALCENLEQF